MTTQRRWTAMLPLGVTTFAVVLVLAGVPLAAQQPEPTGLQFAAALEDVLVKAIERAEASVVSIARYNGIQNEAEFAERRPEIILRPGLPNPPESLDLIPNDFASGVIIDKSGLIVTTYHAVAAPGDIWVTTTAGRPLRAEVVGPRIPAKVIGGDPRSDLAVLRIIDAAPDIEFKPITFGDATTLKKGQIVIALGNPYAIARDGKASASWGIVANLSRKAAPIPLPPETNLPDHDAKPTIHHFGTLIQTDAKLNLGTSGGALLNLRGEMIGLTTSQAAVAGFEQSAGYAIPVDDLFRRVLETLKLGKEVDFGFLGIAPLPLAAGPQASGVRGILVDRVVSGTPAERVRLIPGDVITHIGGTPINTVDDLMLQVGRQPAAAETSITYVRDGRVSNRPLRLAKFEVRGKKIVTSPDPGWRGVTVDFPTAHRTVDPQQFNLLVMGLPVDPAVFVVNVEPDSPAWKSGLRRGMLITHIQNVSIETPQEFYDQAKSLKGAIELRIGGNDAREHPVVRIGE